MVCSLQTISRLGSAQICWGRLQSLAG